MPAGAVGTGTGPADLRLFPAVCGIRLTLHRDAAVLLAKSGNLVPYYLAKALVKSANKGSKQAEKLHK